MVDLGYDDAKITVDYKGEIAPLNQNKNKEEKRINRRVEIIWEKPQIAEEDADNIQDLYALLTQEKQTFCINPNRDTLLHLEQGTIINVPAHIFNTTTDACVEFSVKEIYKYSDMLLENLATTSNGKLLETGGMVYTEAKDENGNTLQIKSGKSFTIMLPTDNARDDMGLFYGERDPHTQEMNWLPSWKSKAMYDVNGIFPFRLNECIGSYYPIPECDQCHLFLCRFGRIDEAIKGIGNKEIRQENKEFRACQKSLRKGGSQISYAPTTDCSEQFALYGLDNYEDLQDTLRKIRDAQFKTEYAKYGVDNYTDYTLRLQKISDSIQEATYKETITNLENNTGSMNDLNYYVARVNKLGWINCDAFSNVRAGKKITMQTNEPQRSDTDCKLVFIKKHAIMRPDAANGNYGFRSIPPKLPVWLFALKYKKGQAYICLEKTETKVKADPIEFKPVSLKELKTELQKLDF